MPVQIFGIVPGSIQVIRSLLCVGKSTEAVRPRCDRGATAERPRSDRAAPCPPYWEAGLTGT
jgi:hypothetical protein